LERKPALVCKEKMKPIILSQVERIGMRKLRGD
jgi:hypothetical protein